MKKLVLISTALCFAFISSAENGKLIEQFKKANSAYVNSNFEEAIMLYNSLLREGNFSADLHYNLGNAYYKMDSIPKAILHYEKALRLNPQMSDAEKNLALANLKTIDKIEPIPDLFLSKWWKSSINVFHADTWAKLAVGFMFLAFAGMIIYFFSHIFSLRKTGFYIATITLILSLSCWFLGRMKNSYLQNSTEAIIMTPTINVYSSPTEGSTKLFVLHKGTKVDMENRKDEWIKIRIPDGNEGWMKWEEVAEI